MLLRRLDGGPQRAVPASVSTQLVPAGFARWVSLVVLTVNVGDAAAAGAGAIPKPATPHDQGHDHAEDGDAPRWQGRSSRPAGALCCAWRGLPFPLVRADDRVVGRYAPAPVVWCQLRVGKMPLHGDDERQRHDRRDVVVRLSCPRRPQGAVLASLAPGCSTLVGVHRDGAAADSGFGPQVAGRCRGLAEAVDRLGRVGVMAIASGDDGDGRRTRRSHRATYGLSPASLAHGDWNPSLEVREAEGGRTVAPVGGAEDREQRRVLGDGHELAVAERLVPRREVDPKTLISPRNGAVMDVLLQTGSVGPVSCGMGKSLAGRCSSSWPGRATGSRGPGCPRRAEGGGVHGGVGRSGAVGGVRAVGPSGAGRRHLVGRDRAAGHDLVGVGRDLRRDQDVGLLPDHLAEDVVRPAGQWPRGECGPAGRGRRRLDAVAAVGGPEEREQGLVLIDAAAAGRCTGPSLSAESPIPWKEADLANDRAASLSCLLRVRRAVSSGSGRRPRGR